ncbi:DUF2975 domain-containing protein [Arundinibacter roseus]|uniref:DUF2975 domain-containing protein n=1 Tax=Arundinibacter roseus TaxID=2070510 RepID=A0A4R4KHE4_9BACT|nr:DUF2975 domain-containing protein [Arundinibacter roseus]TDB67438.1 DUF2975 domain-containing protein [Arundinibacter roseus]
MFRRNNLVFGGLYLMAWLIFVGLCVEAGGMIVNFVFSLYNPDFVKNLYQKLDLSQLYSESKWGFFSMYSFLLSIFILKAWLFYIIIGLVGTLNLSQPFKSLDVKQILRISSCTFSIGLLSYLAQQTNKSLENSGFKIDNIETLLPDSQAFILMAGIIYVIAAIVLRGVEIQKENDLTI